MIVKEGGLQLIIVAIKTHLHNSTLQSEACRTLYNIARNVSDEALITEGLELIMNIMIKHKEDANVQVLIFNH
jgi:hypothetical protein